MQKGVKQDSIAQRAGIRPANTRGPAPQAYSENGTGLELFHLEARFKHRHWYRSWWWLNE